MSEHNVPYGSSREEEALITMLRSGLPLSVQIALVDDHYCWHVLDGTGIATDLIEATRQALTYLLTQIATDSITAGTASGKTQCN